jgi:hypothetical protein
VTNRLKQNWWSQSLGKQSPRLALMLSSEVRTSRAKEVLVQLGKSGEGLF